VATLIALAASGLGRRQVHRTSRVEELPEREPRLKAREGHAIPRTAHRVRDYHFRATGGTRRIDVLGTNIGHQQRTPEPVGGVRGDLVAFGLEFEGTIGGIVRQGWGGSEPEQKKDACGEG
jgi:hypothetical protein